MDFKSNLLEWVNTLESSYLNMFKAKLRVESIVFYYGFEDSGVIDINSTIHLVITENSNVLYYVDGGKLNIWLFTYKMPVPFIEYISYVIPSEINQGIFDIHKTIKLMNNLVNNKECQYLLDMMVKLCSCIKMSKNVINNLQSEKNMLVIAKDAVKLENETLRNEIMKLRMDNQILMMGHAEILNLYKEYRQAEDNVKVKKRRLDEICNNFQ